MRRYADLVRAIAIDPIGIAAREAGIKSAVGSPIVVEGHLWGVVTATSTEGPLPPGTEARLASFTELIGTAIANAKCSAELAASRARIAAAAHEERRRVVRDLYGGAQHRLVQTVMTLKLAQQALDRGGDDAPDLLPAPVEATASFVVAEALTNMARHFSAGRAGVVARIDDGMLRVEVPDDGVGGAITDGTALVGLADRLALLDGGIRRRRPQGWRVATEACQSAGRRWAVRRARGRAAGTAAVSRAGGPAVRSGRRCGRSRRGRERSS